MDTIDDSASLDRWSGNTGQFVSDSHDKSPTNKERTVLSFKVIILGDPAVGKTSLLDRYVDDKFNDFYKSTIGSAFSNKTVFWDSDYEIHLHLWDLAGQDRLGSAVKVFYREAVGALCVCDIMRPETKTIAEKWKQLVEENAISADGSPINPPCFLLVNKMDLYIKDQSKQYWVDPSPTADEMQTIDLNTPREDQDATRLDRAQSQISKIASASGFDAGFATSARDNFGIDAAMKELIRMMIKRYEDSSTKDREVIVAKDYDHVDLVIHDHVPFKSRSGCNC
jgi:small GTP-binding protein